LVQLGHGLMNELVDLIADTGLEDFSPLLCEALIGAFHSAHRRIERDGDKTRDTLNGLLRDFDGSEVLDVELQDATRKARASDVAAMAVEIVRDAASAAYTTATGEVWSPWAGSVRPSRLTASQVDAKDALRAREASRTQGMHPGKAVVVFRGAPHADTAEDAQRIFDALNFTLERWPDMSLATSGAKGAEKLAIRWAAQKAVPVILARADFNRYRLAAPFRANDELLALNPVCVLTLDRSLNDERRQAKGSFGPAASLAETAQKNDLMHYPLRRRRP
jgi:hypothetical protein